MPFQDDIEWDPVFEDIYNAADTKRSDICQVNMAGGKEAKEMKLGTFDKRLSSLEEAGCGGCPRCQALAAMSTQEIDLHLADLKEGQYGEDLPESSPSCKRCHKYDGMTEAELDAELARLRAILEKADSYES